jgi:hypothetical protein
MHADPPDAQPPSRPHRRRALLAIAGAAGALAALSLGSNAAAAVVEQPATAPSTPTIPVLVLPARATFTVVTVPAGSEAGWAFTLVGPGTPVGGEKLFTTGPGATLFTTPLAPGLYTVAQTTLPGWDQTGATGCVFTVAYPADTGRSFACTVTDTKQGHVTLASTHDSQPPQGADAFQFTLSGGPGALHAQQVADAADKGSLDFGQLPPGAYTLCQQAPPSGWSTTLTAQGGTANGAGEICLAFALAPGETRAFKVDTASPVVASPTPSPTPTATPTPTAGVAGITSAPSGVAVPNTGVGSSALLGGSLLLAGLALMGLGRRRRR